MKSKRKTADTKIAYWITKLNEMVYGFDYNDKFGSNTNKAYLFYITVYRKLLTYPIAEQEKDATPELYGYFVDYFYTLLSLVNSSERYLDLLNKRKTNSDIALLNQLNMYNSQMSMYTLRYTKTMEKAVKYFKTLYPEDFE